MIEFPCPCGRYKFEVPQDQAGGLVQCPECARLNDVPNIGEIEAIDDDGAYKIADEHAPTVERQDRRERLLARQLTRQQREESGEDVDLRPTFDEIMDAGTDDGPLMLADEIPIDQPKYDPLTGELIKPLAIKPEHKKYPGTAIARPADLGRPSVLEYARRDGTRGFSILRVAAQLLGPVNLLVMGMILAIHLIVTPVNVMMAAGVFFVAPIWLIVAACFIAHYGNVIDEMGPSDKDELPRPMRDFSLTDDIWRPFTQVTGSFLLCFGLAFVAAARNAPAAAILLIVLAGTFFFPAVLLTQTTSGTSVNLRPDRLYGVIRAIGGRYVVLIAMIVAALCAYYLSLWRLQVDFALLFVNDAASFRQSYPWWFQPYLTYPLMPLAVFATHLFCATLGVIYRTRHEQFPWILQRHIPTKLAERNRPSPARLAKLNANSAAVREKLAQPSNTPPRVPR